MKKLTFEQSRQLVQLMTVLLQLGVINLETFAVASVEVADITAVAQHDYLQMVLDSFGNMTDIS